MEDLGHIVERINATEGSLFILCGYPYSGKSYIARQLVSQTDILLIQIDDIFRSHGFDWDTSRLPNAMEWQSIFNESYDRTKEGLKNGKNVLYDSTNQTIASREVLRELAETCGAESFVLYVKASMETVWKRWEGNATQPTRPVVSKDLVAMTIESFEEPLPGENVLVIQNES